MDSVSSRTGNYSETGIHLYGEYGVTDWLTVIGAWAPFQVYRLAQLGGTTVTRPTDPLLGARFGLVRKEWRLSLELDTRFPFVTDRAFTPFFDLINDRALSVGVVAEGALLYERQAGGPVFSLYLAKKWDGS